MQVHYTPASIFLLLSLCLCFLIGMVLLVFAPRNTNKSNFLLGAYFLTFGYTIGVIYLIFTQQILYLPHLYRTGHFSWLLCIPLAYLYVRVIVKQQPLAWGDLVHLLPLTIFLIDYMPFLLSTATFKLEQIKADLQNLEISNSFRQGWLFPPHAHVIARLAIISFYGLLQLRLLLRVDKNDKQRNRKMYNWLLTFSVLQILPVPIGIFSMLTSIGYVWCTCIPPAAAAFLASVNLFLYPQVLYGMQSPEKSHPAPIEEQPAPTLSVIQAVLVSQKKALLQKIMEESRPWLNSNYTLADLANDLQMSLHQASALINQATGKNFNDYLNQHRINYAIDLIKAGKAVNLNLKGISELCGFNNRNTFTNAFKKVTGMSPSEFLYTLRYRRGLPGA